jgi:putative (di)nucleoside polyphosphate hydrolase
MAREISCGVLLLNERRQLLLAHVTGQRQWDIPKGLPEPGEAPAAAALRETFEETGVVLAAAQLRDLGVVPYRPGKDLHLFLALVDSRTTDPGACACSSFFTDRFGRSRPEVDAFRWAALDEVATLCTPRLAAVLHGLLRDGGA